MCVCVCTYTWTHGRVLQMSALPRHVRQKEPQCQLPPGAPVVPSLWSPFRSLFTHGILGEPPSAQRKLVLPCVLQPVFAESPGGCGLQEGRALFIVSCCVPSSETGQVLGPTQ